MIVPHCIDLDRLHSVIKMLEQQKYRGRQEGKTLAYLMLMLGEVELGGSTNTYLYLGENGYFAAQVAKAFVELVNQELPGVLVEQQPMLEKVIVNQTQRFFFISAPLAIQNHSKIRGWSIDRAFVDLDDATQHHLERGGQLTEFFQHLMIQLSYKHGDVI